MARLVLLLVAMVALCFGADAFDAVAWSANHESCKAGRKVLVFVFDDFTIADFSRSVGAYREKLTEECQSCTLPLVKSVVEKQRHSCVMNLDQVPEVNVDGADVNALLDAARVNSGTVVVNMRNRVDGVTIVEDATMVEAIQEALKVADGDLTLMFTGRPVSSNHARTLQTSQTPLILMAPDTFIGMLLIVSATLILIFFMCCCMDTIESQTKYAKSYPLKGKELN